MQVRLAALEAGESRLLHVGIRLESLATSYDVMVAYSRTLFDGRRCVVALIDVRGRRRSDGEVFDAVAIR